MPKRKEPIVQGSEPWSLTHHLAAGVETNLLKNGELYKTASEYWNDHLEVRDTFLWKSFSNDFNNMKTRLKGIGGK